MKSILLIEILCNQYWSENDEMRKWWQYWGKYSVLLFHYWKAIIDDIEGNDDIIINIDIESIEEILVLTNEMTKQYVINDSIINGIIHWKLICNDQSILTKYWR